MKLTLTLTTLLAGFSAAAVMPSHEIFRLKVPSSGPAPLAGKTVTLSPGGGGLGFYKGGTMFQGYIKGKNPRHGVIVDLAKKTSIAFLRPTHGTPAYYVLLGDPNKDSVPQLTLWKDFQISSSKAKHGKGENYWLDYNPVSNSAGATSRDWVACGDPKHGYTLYFGTTIPGCTKPFQLQVEFAKAK